ncbi:MAG: cardiolipin synthase [Bacteroidales bacterium]|nr:cardiolipin synthase [Bacteroidales bacterium]
MNFNTIIYIAEIIYFILIILTIIKIIYDTRNSVKSLAYILVVVFIPVVGMFIYFSIGENYRKKKFYKAKNANSLLLYQELKPMIETYADEAIAKYPKLYDSNGQIIKMLVTESLSPLAAVGKMKLLLNGENKFPELLKAMENAQDHIHIEYFVYNDDEIGVTVKDVMIKKAREGVKVRFIFDDYGSHIVRRKMLRELREAGVEAYPFYEIKIYALANRMNYRNHRKIVVIDGKIGFIGGINIADRYVNNGKNKLFWRDTHLMLEGNAATSLQYIFFSDWNFCKKQENLLTINEQYFPVDFSHDIDDESIQIAASGPDSRNADIMLSFLGIIMGSKKRLYITTPYFIPNETIVDAIKYSALSGVDVRLLVPGISDSRVVNAASCSYYQELLESGVRIYRYQKGFVHAKTIVSDDKLSVIGTANMDIRSFDLMFEVNANIYSREMNEQLYQTFLDDLQESVEVLFEEWNHRSKLIKFGEYCARLISPLL